MFSLLSAFLSFFRTDDQLDKEYIDEMLRDLEREAPDIAWESSSPFVFCTVFADGDKATLAFSTFDDPVRGMVSEYLLRLEDDDGLAFSGQFRYYAATGRVTYPKGLKRGTYTRVRKLYALVSAKQPTES